MDDGRVSSMVMYLIWLTVIASGLLTWGKIWAFRQDQKDRLKK